jgi:hypothetical protein
MEIPKNLKVTEMTVDNKDGSGTISYSDQQQSSASIHRNAKGEYAYEIKVYNDDPEALKEKLKSFKEVVENIIKG